MNSSPPPGLLLVLEAGLPATRRNKIRARLEHHGGVVRYVDGGAHPYLEVAGEHLAIKSLRPESWEGVLRAVATASAYPHASWEGDRGDGVSPTLVSLPAMDSDAGSAVELGPGSFTLIAGPCAVETRAQTLEIAQAVKAAGAQMFRAGAYKPRTSPYGFQGLEQSGLEVLAAVRSDIGLPVVTEILEISHFDAVAEVADMLQVGSRNMQNFALLKELGQQRKPVLLKRGFAATLEEFLLAAEYILAGGNENLVLCERGLRSSAGTGGVVLDLAAVEEIHRCSHLPVLVDPSHGTGARHRVAPLARAATVVGADGLMIEVHGNPTEALSDGPQALTFAEYSALVQELRVLRAGIEERQMTATPTAEAGAE